MSKKIYLIDGNSFIYRMFFGVPPFSTRDGRPVNAIFGMAKFFINQLHYENPDYLVFIQDAKGKNFRHEIYKEYKATRDRMPDDLRSQISEIESMIFKMWIDTIATPGYEADDVIWTLALELWADPDNEVFILSGDKDLYALITENVKVYDTQKRKTFDIEGATEKFWVAPKYVIDYLAIVGDSADNIPGVAWFGPKKAVSLINTFWTIEEIYKAFDDGSDMWFKGKTLEKFEAGREMAFLSKRLATLDTSVDLSMCPAEGSDDDKKCFDLESYAFDSTTLLNDDVKAMFRNLEFFSLIGETEVTNFTTWKDTNLKVKIIWDDEWLSELTKKLLKEKEIVLDTETTGLDVFWAELVWVSIYVDDKNIYYINRWHNWPQVSDDKMKVFLQSLLASDATIIGHNIKYDLKMIELFLKGNNNWGNQSNDNFWQMWLGI